MAEYNKTLDCVQAALIVVNRQPESHFVLHKFGQVFCAHACGGVYAQIVAVAR